MTTQGQLAITLQEAFTAAVRLRSNRQAAADASSFRTHIKELLQEAHEEARRAGYDSATVKLALYAYVAFIDESILHSRQPMFAEWQVEPLQEEVFGDHMGGEVFFENLQELLSRPDSQELADLLEVHQLCLLLGFEGRYSRADKGELHSLRSAVSERIQRIRGGWGLSPPWPPPGNERLPDTKDEWLGRLVYLAAGAAGFALLLFVIFKLSLHSGLTDLQMEIYRMSPFAAP